MRDQYARCNGSTVISGLDQISAIELHAYQYILITWTSGSHSGFSSGIRQIQTFYKKDLADLFVFVYGCSFYLYYKQDLGL